MKDVIYSKNCVLCVGARNGGVVFFLTTIAFFLGMAVQRGSTAESPVPLPLTRQLEPTIDTSKPQLAGFQKLVEREKSLLGYWPFANTLDSANKGPAFQHGTDKMVFRVGPLDVDSSIDLSKGAYLNLNPSEDLDVPELTVELIFKIKYPSSGALFGIRDGKATRFSLHAKAESKTLKLWNGNATIDFEADATLKIGNWYHLVLAVSAKESILWINGKRCVASAIAGMGADSKGLPFLVGTTDRATGKSERSEILAAHLAIYKTMLSDEAVTARIKAIGWAEKLTPRPRISSGEEIDRIESRISRIKQDHGVDVHYKFVHKDFIPAIWHSVGVGTQLPYEQVPMVLDEIEAFLAVVPKSISKKDLDNIYIFADLKIGGGGMGAMAYGKSIYLCCLRPAIDIRYSLFHEFGHILQVAYPVDDKSWAALLPDKFKYGQNTKANPFGFDDQLRSDGFVINYSTWNRHEDICVLSDYIFVRKDQTLDLMEDYPAIKRKAAAVVKYYQKISPEYDLSFYNAILKNLDAPATDIPKKP